MEYSLATSGGGLVDTGELSNDYFEKSRLPNIPKKPPFHLYRPEFLVWDTVRNIWRALGGEQTWLERSYEKSWCATQSIFFDLRTLVANIKNYRSDHARPLSERHKQDSLYERFKPRAALAQIISTWQERTAVIAAIEDAFGVFVGKKRQRSAHKSWWLVWVIGLFLFVTGMAIPVSIVLILDLPDTPLVIALAIMAMFFIIGGGAYIMSRIYQVRYRFPKSIQTVRDLVLLIRDKRTSMKLEEEPRIRPIPAGFATMNQT